MRNVSGSPASSPGVQKPVSVCIIVEDLPVPFDRRVWQEARALAEAGYRVAVICRKSVLFKRSHEKLEGIDIYRHRVWEAATPLGYLLEYAGALAAELYLAVKVFARTRFRILHACNPPDTIFLIGLFFRMFSVRFIFDHHDLNPELFEAKFGRKGLFYRLVRLAERCTFRTAKVAIATNESYRSIAVGRGGIAPERVFVVRSCPDLAQIHRDQIKPELKQGRRFLVVYLGTMGRQEGVDLLIESVACLVKAGKRDDVLFVLIGGGTEVTRLKALVAEQQLDDAIRFTGRIPDSELEPYLATADVCVAPDPKNPMNDQSTMNKVLQYIAYGRPVVMYDLVEGRRSAGDAALYARPNDPEDFARQIATLLDSESLRRELGERGRARIETALNWENEKKVLLQAYATALDAEGERRRPE